MKTKTFNTFRELIYQASGISLNDQKESLLSARIAKRMRACNIPDQEQYLEFVLSSKADEELVLLLDAISTNVTHFFREERHFEVLSTKLQKWYQQGQRRFRLWSAASSTGEEPYSMAMTVKENLNGDTDTRILATDISNSVLLTAQNGIYKKKDVERMSPALRQRYFQRGNGKSTEYYRVKSAIHNMVTYGRLNLSRVPYPIHGPLDVIFCRNVMIYFDNTIRARLLEQFHRLLKPGGYLMVGHAESLTGLAAGFQVEEPAVYIKH